MKSWQEELLCALDSLSSADEIFSKIQAAAHCLGFDHCAYGLRVPLPVSNPKVVVFSNYPAHWSCRYRDMNYLHIDPTVAHARKSQRPVLWTDELFREAPQLWREANEAGLSHGWAQSNLHLNGVGGMLTLARRSEPITTQELACKESNMRWLVSMAHMALSRALATQPADAAQSLTQREIEVLKWTADGKTCSEISDILAVSEHTVHFHVKNAVWKLGSANKTSAAVRAAMLGLLH